MPDHGAEYSSRYVSTDEMAQFANDLPACIQELFCDTKWLVVRYGWSCNLHQDLWFKPMKVPFDVFPYFLEESIQQKILIFGESDLHIECANEDVRILLCHESDIHIDGNNKKMIQAIAAKYPAFGFRTSDEWKKHDNSNPDTEDAG